MNKVGIPKGVYNVVHGFGPNSAGEFLTAHRDIDAITFTGETRTGAAIQKAAADGIRDVSFELGGKNAAIVFADCDLDAAIEGTMRSVFLNCGQVCLGTERVYVERPIFDKFVAALAEYAEFARAAAARAASSGDPHSPWHAVDPWWANSGRHAISFTFDGEEVDPRIWLEHVLHRAVDDLVHLLEHGTVKSVVQRLAVEQTGEAIPVAVGQQMEHIAKHPQQHLHGFGLYLGKCFGGMNLQHTIVLVALVVSR